MIRRWWERFRLVRLVWKISEKAPCLIVAATQRGAISYALGSGNRVDDRRVMKHFDAEIARIGSAGAKG